MDHASGSLSARLSAGPRSSGAPGMGFGHDLLIALIMAIAMTLTVLLYR